MLDIRQCFGNICSLRGNWKKKKKKNKLLQEKIDSLSHGLGKGLSVLSEALHQRMLLFQSPGLLDQVVGCQYDDAGGLKFSLKNLLFTTMF